MHLQRQRPGALRIVRGLAFGAIVLTLSSAWMLGTPPATPAGLPTSHTPPSLHSTVRPTGSASSGQSHHGPAWPPGPPISPGRWVPSLTPYTLDAINGTIEQGVRWPPAPNYLWGGTFDADTGEVWFGDYQGSAIFGVNGSTGIETRAVQIPISSYQRNLSGAVSTPQALAYDPVHHVLAVAANAASSVTMLNATTAKVEHVVKLLGPGSVAYDPSNHLIYVGGDDANVTAIDGGNGTVVARISVPGWMNRGLAFDPLAHRILGVSQDSTITGGSPGFAYAIDDVAQKFVTNFTSPSTAGPTSIVFNPANGEVYVLEFGNGDVSVYNGSSLAPITTLIVGGTSALCVNPISDVVYVSGVGTGMSVIYGSNDTVARTGVRSISGSTFSAVVFDPANRLILAAEVSNGSIELLNASNGQAVHDASLLSPTYLQAVYDPDNGLVYAAAYTPAYAGVSMIEPSSHPTILGGIATGGTPSGLAYDSADHRLFVTSYWNDTLIVINTTTNVVVNRSIAVGSHPYGVAYDSRNGEVYVANSGSNVVSILNATTLVATRTPVRVGLNPFGVAVDTRTNSIFVTNLGSANVTVLNGSSDKVAVANITVGTNPQGVLYDPQNREVYVANTGSNSLSVISTPADTVLTTIPVGGGPAVLTLDQTDRLLFTGNANANSVTVVNTSADYRVGPDLRVSQTPEGIAYVPGSQQVYVTNWNAGAINLIANAPVVGSVRLSATPAEEGVPVMITTVETNGTGPYTFSYSGLPTGCPSVDAATLNCVPVTPGAYHSSVTVTDSAGYLWTAPFDWSAVPRLALNAIVAGPNPVDVGTTSEIRVTVAGGVASANSSYSYVGLPPGCVSYNSSRFACTPSVTGNYAILVTVTDPVGGRVLGIVTLEVVSRPALLALFASPASLSVNSTTVLVFWIGGGTAPLTYGWAGLPPGCSSSNVPDLACSPNESGTYQIVATATDGLGLGVYASVTLMVSAPATAQTANLSVPSFLADPSTVALGQTAYLFGTPTGGIPPYSLVYSGLPNGCASSPEQPLPCRPSAPGTYSIDLEVRDSAGAFAYATTTLVVSQTPATVLPSHAPASSPAWWVVAGAGGLTIGIVAVLVAGRARRRGKP